MPRIDPLQLINCLQVLLSPNGGILSNHEVHRLVSLMTKFSKKLVSKCVYVLILKNTENTLLDSFMNAGGWTLIQLWLHDGMYSTNWALVKELLELLLITPVDVERLKSNNIPKLVKSLSKRDDLQGIHELSSQLVQQWLKIVKGETNSEQKQTPMVVSIAASEHGQLVEESMPEQPTEEIISTSVAEQTDSSISTQTFYKVTLKDGKHLISKVDPGEANCEVAENVELVEVKNEAELKEDPKEKDKEKKEDKKKSHDRSKHKSSSSSKSSNSSSRDKERSSSSHKDRDKHSSSSSKDKDKNRDKEKRDKDRDKDKRSRSNGSVKSNSSSGSNSSSKSSSSKDKEKDKKETKEKQAEKDKDTLAKLQPQSVQKLPKIPKKTSDEKDKSKVVKESKKEEPKKGTMSIEVRKNNEERPKTVKVYKSKMRLTGLEEEAKPAPPRPVKKPGTTPPVVIPPVPLKRPSPIRDLSVVPPEKKTKIEPPLERPGAIKLIPPKPKPPVLQESDMFMDALAASATSKKEPKKRKRRASVSKDSSGTSPPASPSQTTTNAAPTPIGLKNIAAPKFYQDTLEAEEPTSETSENAETKEAVDENKDGDKEEEARSSTPTPNVEDTEDEPTTRNNNGLKGVLVYMRRKGPKKSIKWKPDEELVDVQYFELDETERVNVTKTFGDMAKMDQRGEREALQMSRKLPNEDVMDVQTIWRIPIEIDLPELLALPGSRSLEKDIQFAREKSVLQALYFSKKMLPDSPGEPDPENYQIKDPITIPIDDVENPEHDFRNKPWPEPKGSPPPQNMPNNVPPMFANPVQVNFQNFGGAPPPGFQNIPQNIQTFAGPPFIPQNVMGVGGAEWNNVNMPNMHNPQMIPPNMAPPEMMNQGPINQGPMNQGPMNQGPMNPNMYMQPPDNFNPMMNDNNHRFPPPFNQHQQGPGMFPQNNFNANRGGFGGFRRGGSGPWLRMNGPSPGGWNNSRGGGGPHRGGARLCNNIRNKGFCRNRDNCPYFHPNN